MRGGLGPRGGPSQRGGPLFMGYLSAALGALLVLAPSLAYAAVVISTRAANVISTVGIKCVSPRIDHALPMETLWEVGAMLEVRCYPGYRLQLPTRHTAPDVAATRYPVCLGNGTWDYQPVCAGCPEPQVPDSWVSASGVTPPAYGGAVDIEPRDGHEVVQADVGDMQQFPVGSTLAFSCYPGYVLQGARSISCTEALSWSARPPQCLVSQFCEVPTRPPHGSFLCHPGPCDRYVGNTVVEYYCDAGFTLKGEYRFITCHKGVWSPPLEVACVPDSADPGNARGDKSLTSPWAIVAATASSVVMVLLLIVVLVMLQPRLKSLRHARRERGISGSGATLLVDGVPVSLPSYDEATGASALSSPLETSGVIPGAPLSPAQPPTLLLLHQQQQQAPAIPGTLLLTGIGPAGSPHAADRRQGPSAEAGVCAAPAGVAFSDGDGSEDGTGSLLSMSLAACAEDTPLLDE
ncbi:sushi domain-containing protein 6-like [Lethenteron reissneri]|uniref:sushi domain-containing protein 6-like n=1 Tax=Lethenteron reissneri TaxID=7753 RepID=UPI002AB70B7E|nr:sushi domain-containing protein 6-like [Lethenteron reissneri]XP_061407396.1 sushi domain-containing protein 6-like [Lethenteron reissneri]